MILLLAALAGYFVGAIPFGFLVAKLVRGIDIRQHGSGSIGATNVGRVLGLKWFFLVFLLDFAKAAIPVGLLAQGYLPQAVPQHWPNSASACVVGLSILLGNMFPIYLHGKGGKGAATGMGIILPLAPVPALAAVAAFLVIFLTTRYVSLGSITACLALVGTQLLWHGDSALSGEAAPVTWLFLVGAALVILAHRHNIIRLLRGQENRIGRKKQDLTKTA